MTCLKAARACTGRPKIAKVEGAYHGLYDYAEVSQTAQPDTWGPADAPASVPVAHGTPASVLKEVVVIPFNDVDRALAILDGQAPDVACVLLDPLPHRVGLVPAAPEYVQALRSWCDRHGALLVFDEVITFRSAYGGARDWFETAPDLTALGKIIGGGFPVGAVAGRRDVMEVLNPLAPRVRLPHSGTFSANPVTMVAGLTTMRLFDGPAVARLNALGARARTRLSEAIAVAGVPACVTGGGSLFRVHMKAQPPRDYRSAFPGPEEAARLAVVLDHLFAHGILVINTCTGALSTPMTEHEIDRLADVMLDGLRAVARVRPPAAAGRRQEPS
jgi:glutamate-1-semialdehyde 2,1-aminomutase